MHIHTCSCSYSHIHLHTVHTHTFIHEYKAHTNAHTHSCGSWTLSFATLLAFSPAWECPSRSYFPFLSPNLIICLNPSKARCTLTSAEKAPQFYPFPPGCCSHLSLWTPRELTVAYFSPSVQQPVLAEHLLRAGCDRWGEPLEGRVAVTPSLPQHSGGAGAHGTHPKPPCKVQMRVLLSSCSNCFPSASAHSPWCSPGPGLEIHLAAGDRLSD